MTSGTSIPAASMSSTTSCASSIAAHARSSNSCSVDASLLTWAS
nr:hypothetical protein [Halolamina pelagica]